MTDAQFTREEIEQLLAMCEAATEPPWYWPFISKKLCSDPVTMAFDIERRDAEFIITARTALPRALREVLRLQEVLRMQDELARRPELRLEGPVFPGGNVAP